MVRIFVDGDVQTKWVHIISHIYLGTAWSLFEESIILNSSFCRNVDYFQKKIAVIPLHNVITDVSRLLTEKESVETSAKITISSSFGYSILYRTFFVAFE